MKILNVVSTPFELYYLSSVACLLLERDKNLEIKLLIRQELEDKINPEIRSLYSETKITEFPTLSFPLDKNPIKTIFNFFDNIYQSIKFTNYLKKFNFDADIICISSSREYFANILCRHVPRRVRLVALRMANQEIQKTSYYKKKLVLSFFLNIKNFFFGYSLMDYFEEINEGGTGKDFISYPYHRTVLITDHNIGKNDAEFRLPPPFVSLKKLYNLNNEDDVPGILVAGERTPLYSSWSKKNQKKYEEFLNYLRVNFKNYKLYFKPRKTLTDSSKFDLKGFQILSTDIPLEEVCLKKKIAKVISVKSTSSKVGAYFGIPAYLLYPMFGLPDYVRFSVESYFIDMNSIIRASKFEDLMVEPNLFIKKYSFDTLSSLYWDAIIK